MTFTARIKRHSLVWRQWRESRRPGGVLNGVRFSWIRGDDYVSGELDGPQIANLRSHPDVLLEVTGTAMPVPPSDDVPKVVPPSDEVVAQPVPSRAALSAASLDDPVGGTRFPSVPRRRGNR